MSTLLFWMLIAQGGDLTTTGIGLHLGYQEAAPFYRSASFPVIVGVKGGAAVSLRFTLPVVAAKGHPTAAKVIAWTVLASGAAGTAWNARQIARHGSLH